MARPDRLAGPEQAGPSVAVRGRSATTCRRAAWSGRPRRADRPAAAPTLGYADRVDQLEACTRGARRSSAVGVAEPRVGAEEGGQREGHLGRVEPLRPLARLGRPCGRRSAGRRARTGSSGWRGPATSKSDARMIWSTSAGVQGEFRSDDAEDLLAAVDLELDRPLGHDLAVRLRRADQAVEAAVVEVAGQPEPRVGRAGGRRRGRGRRGSRRRRRRRRRSGRSPPALPPAVEPLALDPRELGQGVDDLGVGVCPGDLLQPRERAVDVAAVAPFEVVAREGLERPLARPVEAGEAPLERTRGRGRRGSAGR